MTIVEDVAKALCLAQTPWNPHAWETLTKVTRDEYFSMARAALTVARKSTLEGGTMVDASKIKRGDEVTVRAKVALGGSEFVDIKIGDSSRSTCVRVSEIVTHTPAPFEPGELVTWGRGAYNFEFVTEREGIAALWGGGGWTSREVKDLRHATGDRDDD